MDSQPNNPGKFEWNPRHSIGTCTQCGEEVVYNVPRMGPDGGFVHAKTGRMQCGPLDDQSVVIAPYPTEFFS